MAKTPAFKAAYPYQQDVLALPVSDINTASEWYSEHFDMVEVERKETPVPTVLLERDGVQVGFAVNGGDPTQDGAAILVDHIEEIRRMLEAKGVQVGDWQIDERDGKKLRVFFVVAPDGLCYYVHEPL
ncbi:MAG: VOC family protein [Candidatus Latescibacterota bacterium]|jgi:catechol 2,3-dioxygenase-like lactoylglutathione lyase family enzyme|nr:VOC family protein [Candidatus Latescibacterota bacterium]